MNIAVDILKPALLVIGAHLIFSRNWDSFYFA